MASSNADILSAMASSNVDIPSVMTSSNDDIPSVMTSSNDDIPSVMASSNADILSAMASSNVDIPSVMTSSNDDIPSVMASSNADKENDALTSHPAASVDHKSATDDPLPSNLMPTLTLSARARALGGYVENKIGLISDCAAEAAAIVGEMAATIRSMSMSKEERVQKGEQEQEPLPSFLDGAVDISVDESEDESLYRLRRGKNELMHLVERKRVEKDEAKGTAGEKEDVPFEKEIWVLVETMLTM